MSVREVRIVYDLDICTGREKEDFDKDVKEILNDLAIEIENFYSRSRINRGVMIVVRMEDAETSGNTRLII